MPFSGYAQGNTIAAESSNPNARYLTFASLADACSEGRKLAEKDIKQEIPCLLLIGGIAPVVYTTDKNFEAAFKIQYVEEGCSGPDLVCAVAYNNRIFPYLTETFGPAWRKRIRKDVVGFKEWKAKK